MFFILDTDIPRGQRTIADYHDALLTRAGARCMELGLSESQEDFEQTIIRPVSAMCAAGLTGGEIFEQARQGQFLELMKKEPRLLWAVICVAFARQALIAEAKGHVTEAWTYLIDATVCRDGILESAQVLDYVQEARAAASRAAVASKLDKDPKQTAMKRIQGEYERWQSGQAQYNNDADFAKKMHLKHSKTIKNEGSIKNAVKRWRNERKSSN